MPTICLDTWTAVPDTNPQKAGKKLVRLDNLFDKKAKTKWPEGWINIKQYLRQQNVIEGFRKLDLPL